MPAAVSGEAKDLQLEVNQPFGRSVARYRLVFPVGFGLKPTSRIEDWGTKVHT
jgi:hypothetical protein